ncbi:MAG: hypothetical protein VKK98_08680, partial [Cyanobacteriota bacterium]|nr:hypothetical protein [Cyanobacteriota bacterium]
RQAFADHCLHGALPPAAPTAPLNIPPDHELELRRLAARPSFGPLPSWRSFTGFSLVFRQPASP